MKMFTISHHLWRLTGFRPSRRLSIASRFCLEPRATAERTRMQRAKLHKIYGVRFMDATDNLKAVHVFLESHRDIYVSRKG